MGPFNIAGRVTTLIAHPTNPQRLWAGMPDVGYHAAVFETHEPYRLFVACDYGVWMTKDLAAWTDVSTTLPNAIISDLVFPSSRP